MFLMKIVARYVNKTGKLSNKSYIYLIDTKTVALVGPMKHHRYNLGKLFDENPNGDMLMFYIQNQYGKKNNPIIVEEYSYELEEDVEEGTELISIIDGGVYNRIKGEKVSDMTPTNFGRISWDAKVDKSYSNCPHYKEKCKEGNDNMFNKMFKGIEFGKIVDGSIVMSIYGPAFRTADGGYIAHQGHGDYVDADGFLFDGNDSFCFKMPVGRKAVSIGDIIVHNKKYCRIIDCDDRGDYVVEDIMNKEVKTIMSSRSPFGFDFYTKVITFGEDMFKADKDNPFGSMLPMLMMMSDGRKSNDNSMMMAMMMMQNCQTEINPMMMYFMMNGSGGNDMLPMLMMMQSGAFAPKAKHDATCGRDCDCASTPVKDMTDEEVQSEIM